MRLIESLHELAALETRNLQEFKTNSRENKEKWSEMRDSTEVIRTRKNQQQ